MLILQQGYKYYLRILKNGYFFAVTPPTSVSFKMTEDNVTNRNFSPQPNKVYDIIFYLNGIIKETGEKIQDGSTNNRG